MKNKDPYAGIEPNPNLEYLIVRDLEYGASGQKYFRNTVVVNVKKCTDEHKRHDGYYFTLKDTGVEHHTMYPWLLAENTPSSRAKLEEYHKLWDERERLDKIISEKCKELDTLALRD
jgi:hypothetical protein